MKKFIGTAISTILVAFVVIVVMYSASTKEPVLTTTFEFDVPVKGNHTLAVVAVVNYHLNDSEILLSADEVADRVYSNLTTSFHLATSGTSFEEIQGWLGKDSLHGEVSSAISHYNSSPYEIVEIDDLKFSVTFDPPVSNFGPSEEEALEESENEKSSLIGPQNQKMQFVI